MANTPIAKIRWEDLNNRPGESMDGWEAVIVPYVAGASNIGVPFKKGTVYCALLKKTEISTDGVLPDQSAVAFETEATGDMILCIGKISQEFV